MRASFRFADLFAGVGGFHAALSHGGGHCVFASEIDLEARNTYRHNWAHSGVEEMVIDPDITLSATKARVSVPDHDVLAAGFPCQPFSKSGRQLGMEETRGTLFWNIARVLQERRPSVVLLENVRNLAGPRHEHEWETIITTLRHLGYRVSSRPSVFSPHLLPPDLGGTPQARDRVFIVGTYVGTPWAMEENDVPPAVDGTPVGGWDPRNWEAEWALDDDDAIEKVERYRLSLQERDWINTWDDLVRSYLDKRGNRLPGFPLWSDLWRTKSPTLEQLEKMPGWKQVIVRKNVEFYDENRRLVDTWRRTHPGLEDFPASRRKFEWQAQDAGSLWQTLMQMRPSGVRVKSTNYFPALVAITQTSIVGPRRRRLTPREAARLQGLPASFGFLNRSESASYKQVGNGVAVGAAWHVLRSHVDQDAKSPRPRVAPHLREAVLSAPRNPCAGVLKPSAYQAWPKEEERAGWASEPAFA